MPVYKVKVKWGKENYPNVELNTDELPILFKAQLFALTGVQPERQKVMIKGKIVTDDSWEEFPVKDGVQLLMMGAADEIPEAPKEKVAFMEDMNDNELSQALDLPAGLSNLGNTCYLNATVQCLKTVPEFRDVLSSYYGHLTLSEAEGAHNITVAIRDLLNVMDSQSTVAPMILIQVLHMIFPRFAEKSEHGGFQQQDANECWTELLRMLQQRLKSKSSPPDASYTGFIDQYFGGRFKVTLKNTECEDEPEATSSEDFLQLSCFISADVKYLQSGLRAALHEAITKNSSKLERDAVYNKTRQIARLPAYLSVQFVRFQFKERSATNAKILKDIKFSLSLDVFELCTKELQEKLLPIREKFKEIEDRKVAEAVQKGQNDLKGFNKNLPVKRHPYSFADDEGSNNSGFYELQAVLTHKGRSSNSGHYVGWIRRKPGEWFKCDDEDVTLVTEDDILKLSGGGDWHTAYVLLYGPRILETPEETTPEA